MAQKQLVTRLVYGAFVLVVAAFVISNVVQVGNVLFGEAASTTAPAKVGAACAAAVEEETKAIEAALRAATGELEPEAARARYTTERRAEPAKLEAACAGDVAEIEARAALARLDRASETHAVRTASELHPVRAAAHSFIRRSR